MGRKSSSVSSVLDVLALLLLLLVIPQSEMHRDRRFHDDRLAIQNVRTILPFLYCAHSSGDEHRRTADGLHRLYSPILPNLGMENDSTLHSGNPRDLRILRNH